MRKLQRHRDSLDAHASDGSGSEVVVRTSPGQLLVPVEIYTSGSTIHLLAMIDSGATHSFINTSVVDHFAIKTVEKDMPTELTVIDGRPISSGAVLNKTGFLRLSIGQHSESISLDITNLGTYDLDFGMDWLSLHSPTIKWSDKELLFETCPCAVDKKIHCFSVTEIISSNFKTSPSIFTINSN